MCLSHVQYEFVVNIYVKFRHVYSDVADAQSKPPTILELIRYKVGESYINIPQRIGTKYQLFGVMLLEVDYSYIESLERQFMKDAEQINCHILQEWLNGKGKQPKTWATLSEVLVDAELCTLAEEISSQFIHGQI